MARGCSRRYLKEIFYAFELRRRFPLRRFSVCDRCPAKNFQNWVLRTDWLVGIINELSERQRKQVNGLWRSLVAHLTGGQGVAGSNPVNPTMKHQVTGIVRWPFSLPSNAPFLKWSRNGQVRARYALLTAANSIGSGVAVRLPISSAASASLPGTACAYQSRVMLAMLQPTFIGEREAAYSAIFH